MTRKTVKILLFTFALFTLTGVGYLKGTHFFEIDACLDKGGRWNYEVEKCELDELSNISSEWLFDKVDGSKLIFKDGHTFETNLFELEYIGQVSADNKAPHLIFSGRDCKVCDANISIYIHSPADGKLIIDHGQNLYQYPGTEKDYDTDSVLYISRAFYGQVLKNINGVIWYENKLLENGKMGRFVFLTHIKNGTLKDTTYEDTGKLDQTIILKNQGLCKEIKGREYTCEP
ncbi:MAG: hypothetical protein EAY66_08990 [Sphingobacteriales bacterium]|nr:MAG: hypothetical protein EAY66_08990 [Sphingobacteriales bacterium]